MLDGLWRLPVLKRLKGKLRLRSHPGGTQSVYKLSLKDIARVDNRGLRHQRYSRCSQFELGLNDNPRSGAALNLLHLGGGSLLVSCTDLRAGGNCEESRDTRRNFAGGGTPSAHSRKVGWTPLICPSRCAPFYGLDVEL